MGEEDRSLALRFSDELVVWCREMFGLILCNNLVAATVATDGWSKVDVVRSTEPSIDSDGISCFIGSLGGRFEGLFIRHGWSVP